MSKPEETAINSACFTDFLKRMETESRMVLINYFNEYGAIRFFSYGSNLDEKDFQNRMKAIAERNEIPLNVNETGLVNCSVSILKGYKRSLKNASSRGAAYKINRNPERTIEGACHDITKSALHVFLLKEGLLINLPADKAKYRIASVEVSGEEHPVLTLIGTAKSVSLKKLPINKKQKTLEYLKTCILGATNLGIDAKDMLATKKYLENQIKSERSNEHGSSARQLN